MDHSQDGLVQERQMGVLYPDQAVGVMPAPVGSHEEVRLQKVTNGFIVYVGCKTFVADCFEKVSKGLELFYRNRDAAVNEYLNKK